MKPGFFSGLRSFGWAALLVLPQWAHAQLAPDWTTIVTTLDPPALALDASRNSFVSSYARGEPAQIQKLSPLGAVLWQRGLTAVGVGSRVEDLATDAAGNLLVVGTLVDAIGVPLGPLVAKLDPAGNLLWQDANLATPGVAGQLALDATGHVYTLQSVRTAAGQDMQLVKFGPDGVRQWSRGYGARAFSGLDSLVLNSAGQPVVTGLAGSGVSVLASFDALGNPLASASWPGGDLSLAAGPAGEVYAVGRDTAGFMALKYNAGFALQWRAVFPAAGGARRAAVDPAGNLVMTGTVSTASAGGGFGATVMVYNWLTLKASPAGALLWSASHGQPGGLTTEPRALAVAGDGTVYLTGRGSEPVVDATTGVQTHRTALVTLQYSSTGVLAGSHYVPTHQAGHDLRLSGGDLVVLGAPNFLSGTSAPLLHFTLPNQAPVAVASATPRVGTAPLSVAFSAAGSADADGAIASYAWNFGDGQSASVANPVHVYTAGSYLATLTVTDNRGATATAAPILITANPAVLPPPRPVSLILSSPVVWEGGTSTGTVMVSSKAGVTVRLSSSNTGAATLPATVVVPAGAQSASFVITTRAVRRDTVVTIKATANGTSMSVPLTVRNR
jgi:PKD repeat protein